MYVQQQQQEQDKMAAAHDEFFDNRGSEFDLIHQDDFIMDNGDTQHHQQQQHLHFPRVDQEHQLNNGLDFSPLDSSEGEFKRDDMSIGGRLGSPSPVAGSIPASQGPPLESPKVGAAQGATPQGIHTAALPFEEEAHLTEQQQQQQQQKEQLQKEIEARAKEEEALRKEQQQIAQEEIKTFYEQRSKHLERRRAQLKEQTAAAAAKKKSECGSGWARVLWLVENSSSNSNAAPPVTASAASKDRERAEASKLKKMLVELAAEGAKA